MGEGSCKPACKECEDKNIRLSRLRAVNEALAREKDGWMESARQQMDNAEFYRGLLYQVAELCGPEVFVSDDGTKQDSPLALKVAPLIRERLAQAEADKARMESIVKEASGIDRYLNGDYEDQMIWVAMASLGMKARKALTPGTALEAVREAVYHLRRGSPDLPLSILAERLCSAFNLEKP